MLGNAPACRIRKDPPVGESFIEMSRVVLDHIAGKHAGIREKVGAIMGGVVLEHESKTIYNEGLQKGLQKGLQEGLQEGLQKGLREMVRRGLEAGVDASLLARMADVDVATVERWRDATAIAARKNESATV